MLDRGSGNPPEALVSSESPNPEVRPKPEDFPGASGALPVLLLLLPLPLPVSSLEAAPTNVELGDVAFAVVLLERPGAPWMHDPPCSGRRMKRVE